MHHSQDQAGKISGAAKYHSVSTAPEKPTEIDGAIHRLQRVAETMMGLRDRIDNMRARTVGPRPREVEAPGSAAPAAPNHVGRLADVIGRLEAMTLAIGTELSELETAI